jgi:hypothetical protein
MSDHDLELERLLRSALDEESRRYEPAGDGLTKIRARVGKRRWLRSPFALGAGALVAAAAAITAVVVVPSALRGDGGVAISTAPAATAPPATPSGSTPAPTGVPAPSPSTAIGGDPTLPDYAAIWPYPSRRIGYQKADTDVRAGTYPHLSDARQTAIDFVATFIGGNQGLTATVLGPYGPGLLVVVNRADEGGSPVTVSTVQLIRVRKGDDAPYIVVGASQASLGDRLKLSTLPKLSGTEAVTIAGTETRPGEATAVRVALREPGDTQDLGLGTTALPPDGTSPATWTVDISPFRTLTSSGVVAAWTTRADGKVAEFVAAPILLGS